MGGQSINGLKEKNPEFLSSYYQQYEIKKSLRDNTFYTFIAISKKETGLDEGIPFIIKVIPIDSKNALKYSQEYEDIKKTFSNLQSNPNVVPIIKIKLIREVNMVIVIRQYIPYNLKEAMYYLACSSDAEKKWFCFQLIEGLNQIHEKYKCHGDIKPDNILVSSKLSVFLSDISVFKPVYLLIDNLLLYNTVFFRNSADRACYLAPERFVKDFKEVQNNPNNLTKEMDIFSLGVVFAEIFLDKQNIFTKNDIINYKNKETDLKERLNDIKDVNLRILIKGMIELDPKKRLKMSEIRKQFFESICPAPINRFIAHLNLMIIIYGYYENDLLVALLHKHFTQIWKCLCINNNNLENMEIPILKKKLNKYLILKLLNNKYNIYNIQSEFPLAFVANKKNKENKEIFIESEINSNFFITNNFTMEDTNIYENTIPGENCTIIIIKYLLSCLERVKNVSTYFSIFEMIYHFSKIILIKNPHAIIDLIIPYYINLFEINNSKLNIATYNSIIDILNLIDYNKLFLNKIDYNAFNYYIFENIYQLFLRSEKLELKCAIISRLDEIIELENKFLYAHLNTNKIIYRKKMSFDNNNDKNYSQNLLFKTSLKLNSNVEKLDVNYNYIYTTYNNDYDRFKKKLKDLAKNILEEEDKKNDCLKLLIIQKYREICLFCGNYTENIPLFNHLFILFNQNNYFIQKEIIKIFPSLILLFGRKLFYDYFITFIESSCQKKNSELIIIQIIDALTLLLNMELIRNEDDYSKNYKLLSCYKLLIPYLVHPNYQLRRKLFLLITKIIPDDKTSAGLYISFSGYIKQILSENNIPITIIGLINKDLINCIYNLYAIPREIFLIYKYNIDCNYFNINFIDKTNLLSEITKIKRDHFINKIKHDIKLCTNLGLIDKNDIEQIKIKSFFKHIRDEFNKILNKEKSKKEDVDAHKRHFINKINILLNEINQGNKNDDFLHKWFLTCCSKENIYFSKILYLLKVLKYQLDIKDVITNNLFEISKHNTGEIDFKDFCLISDIESSKFKSINPMVNSVKEKKDPKFCFELKLNPSESIIKLIPVNSYFSEVSQNFFVSISNEGVLRLHLIFKEKNFENIYTIKNRAKKKIELDDFILKNNHISYVEKRSKIMIFIAINKKIEVITFELNEEVYNSDTNILINSCVCNIMEEQSLKDVVCIENKVKSDKNYVVLGNWDNSISYYNYIDNSIDYINDCSFFSASYGNIELIISLISSDNILISTSYGFLILYDINLRIFTYAYSFSTRKVIKQMMEYIPSINQNLISSSKKKKQNKKNNFIFILTNDDQITLWNLSTLKPIIINEIIKANDHKEHKKQIPKMEKIMIQKENHSLNSKEGSTLDGRLIKININYLWEMNASSYEIISGEKQGICRALNFSDENLKLIQGDKDNTFNQLIFFDDDENKKLVSTNKLDYVKEEVYFNRIIYEIKNKNENIKANTNTNINKNKIGCEFKEMTDIITLRDFDPEKNIEYIVSAYSDGTIKLRKI